MARGFVYVLDNQAMPGMVKVGSTTVDPMQRAAALSSSSGVPLPFRAACYGRFDDCRSVERFIHGRMDGFRVNDRREFFRARDSETNWALYEAVSWLYHHPRRIGDFRHVPSLLAQFGLESPKEVLCPWRAAL